MEEEFKIRREYSDKREAMAKRHMEERQALNRAEDAEVGALRFGRVIERMATKIGVKP